MDDGVWQWQWGVNNRAVGQRTQVHYITSPVILTTDLVHQSLSFFFFSFFLFSFLCSEGVHSGSTLKTVVTFVMQTRTLRRDLCLFLMSWHLNGLSLHFTSPSAAVPLLIKDKEEIAASLHPFNWPQ